MMTVSQTVPRPHTNWPLGLPHPLHSIVTVVTLWLTVYWDALEHLRDASYLPDLSLDAILTWWLWRTLQLCSTHKQVENPFCFYLDLLSLHHQIYHCSLHTISNRNLLDFLFFLKMWLNISSCNMRKLVYSVSWFRGFCAIIGPCLLDRIGSFTRANIKGSLIHCKLF